MNENRNTAVRQQYEDFPYPRRDPAEEERRLLRPPMEYLARINHHGWRGAKVFGPEFRALVAGGGTGDSSIFLAEQLKGFGGSVVHLEQSAASIGVARERAARRGLANITFVQGMIEAAPELVGGPVDYINCAGVLHHMADPQQGLNALAATLKPDGVAGIMVYARYGRYPTEHMRALFASLGVPEAPSRAEQTALASSLVQHLPGTNPFRRADADGSLTAALLKDEHELHDLLLSPRERSYSVPEFHALAAGAGLKVAGFTGFFLEGGTNASFYRVESYLADHALLARALAKPLEQQQAIAELLHGNIPLHSAYLSRAGRAGAAGLHDRSLVPFFFVVPEDGMLAAWSAAARASRPVQIADSYGNGLTVNAVPPITAVAGLIDGKRSISDIMAAASSVPELMFAPNPAGLALQALEALFASFEQFDWLLLGRGQAFAEPQVAGASLKIIPG